MAFWNTNRIKHECEKQSLVTPYREERAIRCAYELGVGTEAFITSKTDSTTHLLSGHKVTIPPGQFGLLITHEVIFVPPNAIAFISIRARVKFQGLVNVSGFHVDPGFRGRLKFAVYNAGSKEIVLDQDERVFMIWFADLDAESPDPYPTPYLSDNVISSEDVSRIQGSVASPAQLQKNIEELRVEFDKRIHTVEQGTLVNRTLMGLILGIFGTLVATVYLKPFFDGSMRSSGDSQDIVQPKESEVKTPKREGATDGVLPKDQLLP